MTAFYAARLSNIGGSFVCGIQLSWKKNKSFLCAMNENYKSPYEESKNVNL